MQKVISIIVLTALLLMSLAPAVAAAPPAQGGDNAQQDQMAQDQPAGQEYVVQPGDWLSRIAQEQLGDLAAYGIIIEATNQRAAQDNTFTIIVDPNLIEAGQKLWIPFTQEAAGMMTAPQSDLAGTYGLMVTPEGNEGQFFNLSLNPDNTASLRTDFGLGADANPVHEGGTWQINQDGTITVTLNPVGEATNVQDRMVFELQNGNLVGRDFDLRTSVFGPVQGLTLTKLDMMQMTTDQAAQQPTDQTDQMAADQAAQQPADEQADQMAADQAAQQPADQMGQMQVDSAFIGTHEIHLPMQTGPGRDILLELNQDHSVIRITRFIGPGTDPIVETGVWRANPDGTVTVLISAEVGEAFYLRPDVIKLGLQDGQVTPLEYDLNWEATQEEINPEQPDIAQQPAEADETAAAADTTEQQPAEADETAAAADTTEQQPAETDMAQQTGDQPQPQTDSEFVGVYTRYVDTTIGPDRRVILDLNNDFSVLRITRFSSSDVPVVEFGTWELNEDSTATVTLVGYIADDLHETPEVTTYQLQDGLLTATEFDPNLHGPEGVQFNEETS